MSYSNKASSMMGDYANIRAIPAILSVAFISAGMYQFGGISDITLTWLSNYTLTAEHSVIASIGAMLVAFMSSETRDFEMYEDWEKVTIAAGPALILGEQYTTEVTDFIVSIGDPLGYQLAFVVTLASWAVAVR